MLHQPCRLLESNGRKIVGDEFRRMWKKAVMFYFKHLLGQAKDNHKKNHSGQPVPRP